MSIPSISVRRPVSVWMLFLAIVLLGVVSFVRLPINLLPDVSFLSPDYAHLYDFVEIARTDDGAAVPPSGGSGG